MNDLSQPKATTAERTVSPLTRSPAAAAAGSGFSTGFRVGAADTFGSGSPVEPQVGPDPLLTAAGDGGLPASPSLTMQDPALRDLIGGRQGRFTIFGITLKNENSLAAVPRLGAGFGGDPIRRSPKSGTKTACTFVYESQT